MFSRRRMVPHLTLILLALFFLTTPTGTVLALDPLAAQTYPSQHGFTAYPSTHPFLFAQSGAPCYGKSSCYIDSYIQYYAPWGNYWAYGFDYGTQFINILPNGSILTNWAKGNHSSLARWANGPCAGRGTNCVFTARRDYVNTNRQQREEVFAYGYFWIFDLTAPDGNRVLDSGPICAVPSTKVEDHSYQKLYLSGNRVDIVRVEMPSNLSCSYNMPYLAPGGGRPRP